MWNYKIGRFTVRERWRDMLGLHDDWTAHAIRFGVLLFALATMSDPSASVYISPGMWVGLVAFWYWYPA